MEEKKNLIGFLLINKPKNYTSFGVIRYIKKILKIKTKVGHTGTLDDFATGLLIICLSRPATKLAGTLLDLDKEYIVTAKLGELTDSLDKTGEITKTEDPTHILQKDLEQAIQKLGKSYTQIPPIYSALKYKGAPLYKLARGKHMEKKEVEEIAKQKSRTVHIYSMKLLSFDPPFFTIQTTVSKGTYIRSLAHDIANIAGVPATTYELQRTKIGNINVTRAIDLEKIKTIDDIENNMISIKEMETILKKENS